MLHENDIYLLHENLSYMIDYVLCLFVLGWVCSLVVIAWVCCKD